MSNHSVTAQGSSPPLSCNSVVSISREQNNIPRKTQLNSIVHEQIIICNGRSRSLLSTDEKEE